MSEYPSFVEEMQNIVDRDVAKFIDAFKQSHRVGNIEERRAELLRMLWYMGSVESSLEELLRDLDAVDDYRGEPNGW